MTARTGIPYLVGALSLGVLWLLYRVSSGGKISHLYEGNDGRPSTSKFQFFVWTTVVIFAYTAMYALKVSTGDYAPITNMPSNVLIVMGMSVISAASAKAITVSYVSTGRIAKDAVRSGSASIAAIMQDDQGFPDLSKIQMIAWTLIAVATYLIALASKIHTHDYSGLPDIDEPLVVLMGLGHGAYLGKKLVTQDTVGKSVASPAAPENRQPTVQAGP